MSSGSEEDEEELGAVGGELPLPVFSENFHLEVAFSQPLEAPPPPVPPLNLVVLELLNINGEGDEEPPNLNNGWGPFNWLRRRHG